MILYLLEQLWMTFMVVFIVGLCLEFVVSNVGTLSDTSEILLWAIASLEIIGFIGAIFTGVWWIWI